MSLRMAGPRTELPGRQPRTITVEMKGFRRVRSTVFRLLIAVVLGVLPAALPQVLLAERVEDLPKPTDYVSDYAHVLSPQAIARIDSICAQLDHSKADAQIAVVTVQSLDGDDTADYATTLYSKMGIGKKGEDRGVLLLFAIRDHKRSIKTGYGLEGILPDSKTGDIGRSMVPQLKAGDFDGAITLGVSEIAQVIAQDAGITLENQPVPAPRHAVHHGGFGPLIFLIILVIFFAGGPLIRLLLGYSILTSGWGGGGFGGGGWGGGGGDSGGGGFGGFGGGDTGGGGSDGSW
jgi:uncharacterized protein